MLYRNNENNTSLIETAAAEINFPNNTVSMPIAIVLYLSVVVTG